MLVRAVESSKSPSAALRVARQQLKLTRNRKTYAASAGALIDWSRSAAPRDRKMVVRAVIADGTSGEMFLVHRISQMKRSDARNLMKDYRRAGGSMEAVALWFRAAGRILRRKGGRKAPRTAGFVVDAAESGLGWVVDEFEKGVDFVLEGVEAIADAIVEAGNRMADVVRAVGDWTKEQIGDLVTALLEAGMAIADMVAPLARMAYRLVANFVAGMLEVGLAVVDIVSEVVAKSYWALRRITNGVIQAIGIGPYLDAIAELAGDALDTLWRKAVSAARYVQGKLEDTLGPIVEWVADKAADVVEAVLRAWETVGEALETFYEFAKDLAIGVWDQIGEATARIGNSIHYVLEYVKEDLIPAVCNIVRGALKAGFAIASLLAWTVEQAFEVTLEVVRAALEVGVTLGTLIRDTLLNPASALDNIMRAAREIGSTLGDLYQAAIVETAREFLEQVTLSLHRIGEAVVDILGAVVEIVGGALGAVIAILLNTLASYRAMTAREKAEARIVFGDSLDLDDVYLSAESAQNDIIFGVQEFFSGNPESRAFTTMSLINFDVDEGIDRHTLIHELMHVWQGEFTGPFYISEAIHAQTAGDGYNYGYDENVATVDIAIDYAGTMEEHDLGEVTGEGGQDDLADADGDLGAFNREQQAQIVMHYFVRRVLLDQPSADYEPWTTYVEQVRAA